MCGIVGILGKSEAAPRLLEALKRLEYRGYDSSGMATLLGQDLSICRAEGRIVNLEAALSDRPLRGFEGIGHTRWATHGPPSEANAHPHTTEHLALVHNGIIENYHMIKQRLSNSGRVFSSETDSEVVAHLISSYIDSGCEPEEAVARSLDEIEGAFALAILFSDGTMIGARRGSPLAVGYGEEEMFLGSDALSLASLASRIAYLEEGDWVILTHDGARIFDEQRKPVRRKIHTNDHRYRTMDKGDYQHFMLKEIHEQPGVIGDSLHALLDLQQGITALPDFPFAPENLSRLSLSACGTAFYAGWIAKYWIESLARLPVDIDIGSEFRYREPPLDSNGAALFISQSGETMDTLEALRYAKRQNQPIVSIVNVPESSIARQSDLCLLTRAGPEIGVASTKAFTTQLAVLAGFTLALARARKQINRDQEARLVASLVEVPRLIADILALEGDIAALSPLLASARAVFYMGRGSMYPIALEGALKLKEISYIHAEGYAAGEMKHGPIALIDKELPTVILAPSGQLLDKISANIREIVSRSGKVIVIGDQVAIDHISRQGAITESLVLPSCEPIWAPILYSLPMQLLAYHVACLKGTDIDKPRNLAKSVTVE